MQYFQQKLNYSTIINNYNSKISFVLKYQYQNTYISEFILSDKDNL